MKITRRMILCAALSVISSAAYPQGKPAPKDAKLYFITPHDGQKIRGPFWCRFGLRNMGVTHAGDDYQHGNKKSGGDTSSGDRMRDRFDWRTNVFRLRMRCQVGQPTRNLQHPQRHNE